MTKDQMFLSAVLVMLLWVWWCGRALWVRQHPFDLDEWPRDLSPFWCGFWWGAVAVHWPLMVMLGWFLNVAEKHRRSGK